MRGSMMTAGRVSSRATSKPSFAIPSAVMAGLTGHPTKRSTCAKSEIVGGVAPRQPPPRTRGGLGGRGKPGHDGRE